MNKLPSVRNQHSLEMLKFRVKMSLADNEAGCVS